MLLPLPSRATISAGALGILMAGSGCVEIGAIDSLRYVEREEARFAVTGRPEVTLTTFNGSIEVRPWDRSEVLVEIEKHASSKEAGDDIEVRTEQHGDRVTIEARPRRRGRHFSFGMSRRVRLIVSLPAAADVMASTGDGSIDVERITGRIELRSGDGAIRGRDLSGELRVQTGDGSIRLDDIDGALDLGTGDGSIVANGRLSAVRARSGDGNLTIRAETGSAAKDDWSISTGDGWISLELPDDFSAEIDAHTGDGRVEVRGGLSDTIENTRRSARGKLGAGGRSVRLRSGDGSITLRRS